MVPVPRVLLITPDWPLHRLEKVLRPIFESARFDKRLGVMLRDKTSETREILEKGDTLRKWTAQEGISLLVNGRLDIAKCIGADGVHLPEKSFFPSHAREILGSHSLIGVSCHDERGLKRAVRCKANYATLSPVFCVKDKNNPLLINGFFTIAQKYALPILALGGINHSHISELILKKAAGIAVIRSVFDNSDPVLEVQRMLRQLKT